MTRTIPTLLAALDAEPGLTMRAIADAHEEAGEEHLARAWRWLVVHQKWPLSGRIWAKEYVDTATWMLPPDVWDTIQPRLLSGQVTCEYPTCSEALVAAARALADLSRRGVDLETLR